MKVKAHEIKHALAEKHKSDFFLTEVKNGPTHISNDLYIMDGLAIKKSWVNPLITGYEIKVSRNDFLQDEKWTAYKHYCHRLDFVVPSGLIKPDELPEDIGLIYYNPEKRTLNTRRKGKIFNIEMPYEMLYYIIMNRLDNIQHPFFTSKREYFEEYVVDKVNSRQLGQKVSSKLIDEVARLEQENKSLKRENANLADIAKVLRKHGFNSHFKWGFARDIDEALSTSLPPRMERDLKEMKDISERLYDNLAKKETVI
ncbi:MmcB family DNA repair protein [Virgibacillus chiguensis]|uniref:MmcB family DNA repair protein n=1 Tax=Virgibacillus chiguensis TaxID=411959 RepID=UPI001BB07D98|nr:MmcB family DNA repair protein [Virgibacillus chiguensis]